MDDTMITPPSPSRDPAAPSDATVAMPAGVRRRAISAAVACAICMSFGMAPLFFGTFPLFLQPVSREFGWGASVYPQGIMIAGLSSALLGPVMGRVIDALGVRKVVLPGLIVWAAALFSITFIGGSVVLLYGICAVIGLTSACCGPVALSKVISGWFDRQRGLVLNLVLSAAPAVSTASFLLLMQQVIEARDWHVGYHFIALMIALVALPVSYLFLREAPDAAPAAEARPAPVGTSLGGALRSRAFWTVTAAAIFVCASGNAVASHFVAWSAERGITTRQASIALTLFSLAGPLGSLLAGATADRVAHPRTLSLVFAVPLAGLILLFAGGNLFAIPALALVGGGFSAVAGLIPFFTARYFGLANASTIFGVALGLITLSLGLGPVLLGMARDSFGAYGPAIPVVIGCMVLAAALSATLPRYPQEQRRPATPEL